jgi:Protein of unknown function (DUF2961)
LLTTSAASAATQRPDILLHLENDPRPLYQVASQQSNPRFPVVLDVAGSGVIRSIWTGFDQELSIYVDNEKEPSIHLSFNQFAFRPASHAVPFHGDLHGYTTDASYRNINIPFHTHIKVLAKREWCNISYNYSRTLDFDYGRYNRLHVATGSADKATGPFELLNAKGSGAIYALFLHLAGKRIMFEGDTTWAVDGLKAPGDTVTGRYSGTEELFGFGYYFVEQMKNAREWVLDPNKAAQSNYSGIAAAFQSYPDVDFSGYRYFNTAPITWNHSIVVQWGNDPKFSGSRVEHIDYVLFYYTSTYTGRQPATIAYR